MKRFLNFLLIAFAALFATSCTLVDSGEVGIKFKKFGLTNQGALVAQPVSGYVTYNIITEDVFTYPVYIRQLAHP